MVTKEEINGYFLEAIRRLKAEGYTQKDIVKAAGLSQNAISKIKTGQNNAGDDTINKLCNAFKLNPDFFYRGSKQFKMEDKEQQPAPPAPTIDNGSAINAALAAKDETIESLKSEKDTLVEVHARELKAKDDLIQSLRDQLADKDQLIAEQKARLIDYRRIIDSHNGLQDYPFPIGAADERNNP